MREELRGIGFTEKEAEIYLALLRLGKSTVTTLSKELSLDRRVLYDLLEVMAKKGRVRITKINNVSHYLGVPPKELEKQTSDSLNEFRKKIPELSKLEKDNKKSEVSIWYGIKAISRLIHNAIESKEEFVLMGRGGYLLEQMGEARHQFVQKINRIKWRMIQTEEYKKRKHEFKPRSLRYLPEKFNFNTAFAVTKDKLYLFTKKENIEIIEIIDKDFAETYRKYFEIFWNLAK